MLSQSIKQLINSFLILNKISLVLSILLILIILTSILLKLEASKRLSFRLYIIIGLADLLNHICLLFDYGKSSSLCHLLNNVSFFSNFLFISVNLVLAYNLHCIFLLNKKKYLFTEVQYLIFIFTFSTVLTTPLIFLSILNTSTCPIWNIVPSPNDLLLMYGLFGIWVIIPCIYCSIIFILVLATILRVKFFPTRRNSIDSLASVEALKEYQSPPMMNSILRLILYPIVPSLTLLPYIILYTFKNEIPLTSTLSIGISYFASTTPGTINFLFFLFDPAILSIYKELRQYKYPIRIPNEEQSVNSNLTLIEYNSKPELYYLL
ncbi:hypothetical protein K502DRAFT_366869 [Neoconidiobolus thromboides FSU 785]|nr:hypothetical protein K502DRAFT_366869 [Neoconidiobolus thromboides FSU 785]